MGHGEKRKWLDDRRAFFEYITNIFHPFLYKEKIILPVIVFIDSHASHFSIELSEFRPKNGMILVAFFPITTHILQPLDIDLFLDQ